MVGNLYSRVGTEDFVPNTFSDSKVFAQYIEDVLSKYVAWVPSQYMGEFKKVVGNSDEGQYSSKEILGFAEVAASTKRNARIDTLHGQIINLVGVGKDSNESERLKNFLKSTDAKSYFNF